MKNLIRIRSIERSRFFRGQDAPRILVAVMMLGFLTGCIVFGAMAYQMAEFTHSFGNYGTDIRATVTDCELTRGRSATYPLVQYQYVVDGQVYSNTWLAQFEHDDCDEVSIGSMVNIIYLRNDPSMSIYGTMSERSNSGYAIALVLGIGSIAFSLMFFAFARTLFSRRSAKDISAYKSMT